ncbi:aspartate kinase [Anaeromyxobacter oryzae]|uniref:Aspartokinase n=1 Tax=Anaeromyxobacter oryzae TaxID=2918170 RepID=A0ABM7WSR7_9BACT|nr:aspartate kinase [Anaeromyxobacter oryzae]BDG02464.1 aspartokinase [Anaeromyxobacter oryzae]
MACVVQKYGGSSVADVEKIRKVAEKVAATRRAGKDVCVVVSAMGDTTDELLALAKRVSPAPPRRELDMLLSAGERISMALLSMALNDLDVPAISFTGSQSGIITTDAHANARIVEVRPKRVHEELEKGKVVIVAGYQGVSTRKEVTTLGRGGSDTTAVALAAALGADCEIYSDVAGVFTADPRVVPSAGRLDALSYEEMQELAAAGAKVLNAQAVEFAKEKGIAIHARSTFGAADETVVRGGAHPERIAGVATRRELALLAFPAARLEDVLGLLERHGAVATELASPGEGAGVALDLENVHDWPVLRGRLAEAVPGLVAEDEAIGSVSVVGTGLSAGHRVLREVTGSLAALGARPRAVFTSALRVTVYCDAAVLKDAAREIHRRLIG